MHGTARVAMVLCGALAREVIAIGKARGWDAGLVDLIGISAREHMTPVTIAPLVEAKLRDLIPRYERVIVVYGDCGTRGALDAVLDAYNVPRIAGPHCFEMYGGAAHHDALMAEEPGTFFLSDFFLRGFDGLMWKGLGLDKHPELLGDYFANYKQLVYLAQAPDTALLAKAQAVSTRLGLPLTVRQTGYGELETRLAALMDDIFSPGHAPRRDRLEHDNISDPLLGRHPVASPRPRRTRARQFSAE